MCVVRRIEDEKQGIYIVLFVLYVAPYLGHGAKLSISCIIR